MLPIFVVGVGRSGTSLLQALLSSHPDIAAIPETGFFRRYCTDKKFCALVKSRDSESVGALLASDHRVMRIDGALEIVSAYFKSHTDPSAISLYRFILETVSQRQKSSVICDKDPRLIEYIGQLTEAFESNLRVVHIVRDPRAVLASKKKAEWSRDRPLIWHLTANRSQFLAGHIEGPRYLGADYVEVCYEQLTDNPESELRKLTGQLDMSFDPAMLEHGDIARVLVSKEEQQWKGNVANPIDSNSQNKWKSELSSLEVMAAEKASDTIMSRFGYLPDSGIQRSLLTNIVSSGTNIIVRFGTHFRSVQRQLRNRKSLSDSNLHQ